MIRTYFENTRCDLAEVSGFLLGSWSKIQELTLFDHAANEA